MAEPKMISPMLDNFIMGGAMSEHHGIKCYPAIENETGNKYIVKVISVPATPAQLDALILTGAYPDRASALAYFSEIAKATLSEIDTLEKLTELEGFTAYESCQMVPMETADGFEIYLLGPYKRSLAKHFQRHSFTHLDALNLGIDLCSALSVCRRFGYIYIDLKPSNVYVSEQRQFQIGDLGFVRLDSLKYASVPEKYISTYTPPEICDAFSQLNDTMDVYAAGLILYQAYNNGELPFNTEIKPGDSLPAPLYADYEMSEIILKACAAKPEDRWQDPTQMGQAIISYMQRNGASDTPIVPIPAPIPEASPVNALTTEDTDSSPVPAVLPEEESGDLADKPETTQDNIDTENGETELTEAAVDNAAEIDVTNDTALDVATALVEEFTDTDSEDESIDDTSDEITLTDEVSEMLNQAEQLATMTVPEPVVVPDHVDVPVPEPEVLTSCAEVKPETDSESESNEPVAEDTNEIKDAENATNTDVEIEAAVSSEDETPTKKHRWIGKVIPILLLVALLIGGYFFYKYYYLVPVEIRSVEGGLNTLTVYVSADVDESELTVVCSGDYGIKITAPVVGGKAEFTELVSNTTYSINVDIGGFHRLVGNTTTTYSTPAQTNVLQFDAITGDTEDSAILTFTIEGPSCDSWSVVYTADGEDEKTALFTEHMATLSHLTVGRKYTFRLVPDGDLFVTGQSTITFTPRPIVIAKNLQATNCTNNTLSVTWETPDDSVASWSVHCYNDTYNQTITTTETYATFTDLDHTAGYTVEVKAAGMSKGEDIVIPADSVTAENFNVDTADHTKLHITWSTVQEIPAAGWLLRYSIVGTNKEETIHCNTNSATITPIVPNATYKIRLEDTNGNVLLNSERTITTGAPVNFSKDLNGVTVQASSFAFTMCKTPDVLVWGTYDLSAEDYRSTFTVGESASFLVKLDALRRKPDEDVTILYVTRNQDGGIIHSGIQNSNWKDMWSTTYAKLTIPVTPGTPGDYTVDIFFDGMLAHKQAFKVQ